MAIIFNDKAGIKSSELAGLYLMKAGETSPTLAQAGEWHHLTWQPLLDEFTASGPQGVLAVGLDGSIILVKGETSAVLSPNKSWQAGFADASSTNPGVRLYKAGGELMQTISSDPATSLMWQLDSNGFFYLANNQLILVSFPQFQPRVVDANVVQGSTGYMGWFYLSHR
jgi:hypothetical protein